MPEPSLNAALLKFTLPLTNSRLNPSSIYSASAIYFEANAQETDTNKQLEKFKVDKSFKIFERQYQILLHELNRWCVEHSVLLTIQEQSEIERDAEPTTAFSLYQSRLFGDLDVYSIRKAVLFNEGKKSLEELLLLLRDESIMLSVKKKIMANLQESIIVCADGVLTNVIDAKDDLKAAHAGISFLMMNVKRVLSQQYAAEYVRAIHGQVGENEIHYINAYSNHVASIYGFFVKNDDFIGSLKIPHWRLQRFAQTLEKQLTPKTVLKELLRVFMERIILMQEQFNAVFFKHQQAVFWDKSTELRQQGDKLIKQWNKQYAELLPLDTRILFQSSEDEAQIVPAGYNAAALRKELTTNFCKLSKGVVSDNFSQELGNGRILVMNQGLYWVNEGTEVTELRPEEVSSLKIPQMDLRSTCNYLNNLIEIFPEHTKELICSDFFTKLQINPKQLIKWNCYSTLMAMITYHSFTKEQKKIIRSEGFATLIHTHLSSSQCFELLRALFRRSLLDSKILTVVWLTVLSAHSNEQLLLLDELLAKNLVTKDLLEITENELLGFIGINTVWFLADYERFDALEKLMRMGLLTSAMLAAAPKNGVNAGKNVLWVLAHKKQYGLVANLLKKGLLNRELLAVEATEDSNDDAGINAIWLLVADQQFELLDELLDKNLLTSEMMAAAPKQGPNAGKNVLWLLLVLYKQCALGEKLFAHGLLTQELLEAMVPDGSEEKGCNNIWLLTIGQEFMFLKHLLDKKQLTTKMLAAAPQKDNHIFARVNTVGLLVANNQFELIDALLNEGLLTKALLDAPSKTEEYADISIFLSLIYKGQFLLLEKLLDKDLITHEALNADGVDIIGLLCAKEQWAVLKKMVNQRLIREVSMEQPLTKMNSPQIKNSGFLRLNLFSGSSSSPLKKGACENPRFISFEMS